MIRSATLLDLPLIAKMGEEYAKEAKHHDAFTVSWDKVFRDAAVALHDPNSLVIVAVQDQQVVGFFYAVCTELVWSDVPVAVDQLLYVTPSHRGRVGVELLKVYDTWARQSGVKYVRISIASGITEDRTCRLYERLGYTKIAVTYQKEVSHG